MAWTTAARNLMTAVLLGARDRPAQLFLALYEGSADPGGTPVELSVDGYARQVVTFAVGVGPTWSNSADVAFSTLGAGEYQGVGVLDDPTAGTLLFWNDEGSPITIPDSSTVTFAAGDLTVTRT